jgi:acetyltransferase-like isoleucine patch superfamily enzyme
MIEDKPVVIYGIGQQADIAQYYFEEILERKVLAFTIDLEIIEKTKNNLPVLNFKELKNGYFDVFIAIGGIALNSVREFYYNKILSLGFSVTNCIAKQYLIPKNTIFGLNTFFDEHSKIMPFTKIGNNLSSINSNIGHHSVLHDNISLICATVGGNCIIENNCFISLNTTICPGIRIGKYSIIDVGSVVKKDVPPYSVISAAHSYKRKIDSRRVNLLGKSFDAFQKLSNQ